MSPELIIALGVWVVLVGFALMFNHGASKDRDRPDLDEQRAYEHLYGHPRIGIDPPEDFTVNTNGDRGAQTPGRPIHGGTRE